MLARNVGGGLEFGVRVAAGARRSRVLGAYGDGLKVQVAAPASRGLANAALRELLAAALGTAPRDVRIVKGETSPDKIVHIRGIDQEALDKLTREVSRDSSRGARR